MIAAIDTVELRKTYGKGVLALDGVSFAVETGTVFGLLGPNGAGKTTVVRILTTILQPDSGVARLLGHDVVKEPALTRSLIGLAGQYAAVDEKLTARENLWMVGRLNHLSRHDATTRANELLEQFNLSHAGDRPMKTFSGGMRRRIDLAAALVAHPPILFLDEPTTGLDPQSRLDLWSVIEELVSGGTTVLLTTQYLEEADRLANQIAVVDHGRLIAEGTPATLKARLGASVLRLELPDSQTAQRAATALDLAGGPPAILEGTGVGLHIEDGPRQVAEALRILGSNGIPVMSLTVRESSLDDVFLSLTGKHADQGTTSNSPKADGDHP
jgi:daunorubicin resistance ABC transporter ATP-binding subunit